MNILKTREVLGWKHKPQAWFPELPGKAAPHMNTCSDIEAWRKESKELGVGSTMPRKRATDPLKRVE